MADRWEKHQWWRHRESPGIVVEITEVEPRLAGTLLHVTQISGDVLVPQTVNGRWLNKHFELVPATKEDE